MKKIILSLTLVAFALVPALQAADGCSKPKSACPIKQATCSSAKSSCPSEQAQCEKPKSCCTAVCKEACGANKVCLAKKADVSVKGAQLLVNR